MALVIIAIVTVISVIFGLISDGSFRLSRIFRWNFIVAALICAGGLVIQFLPFGLMTKIKTSKLIDHSNVVEVSMDEREKKRKKGLEVLFIGLTAFLITGVLEIVFWSLL